MASWSLLDGICGVLKGGWEVLEEGHIQGGLIKKGSRSLPEAP